MVKEYIKPLQEATQQAAEEIEGILRAMKQLNKKIGDAEAANKNFAEIIAKILMTSPKQSVDPNLLPLANRIHNKLNGIHGELSETNAKFKEQLKEEQRQKQQKGPEQKGPAQQQNEEVRPLTPRGPRRG